jgi:hypothetical protein
MRPGPAAHLRDEAAAVFMVLANEPYGGGPDVGD